MKHRGIFVLAESRNGSADLVDLPTGAVPNLSAVPTEDMASLWYAMSMKNTTQTSATTPSRSDRDRESSPPGGEGAGSAHDETSSSGNKEDEDDDDEDADERLDPRHHDPERLKAFNVSNLAACVFQCEKNVMVFQATFAERKDDLSF